ncbi:MAG: archease [archaeon]|nr:archease [archaeon]MCR4323690.1 archease [Nanoarchaeota archaeon]
MTYKFLEHTADVKFRAEGKTWEEMFSSAADALNETIRGEIAILEKEERMFEIEGKDLETVLHNFLEEFLFLLDAQDLLVSKITKIEFNEKELRLNVTVLVDLADNYKFTNDVKAITFNEMFVRNENDKFECQVVLDV